MATTYNPRIATDGLIYHLDAKNIKSNRGGRSLINWGSWNTTGVGTLSNPGPAGFALGLNQTVAGENSLVSGTDPWGYTNIIWQSNPSGDGNGDGGWDGAYNGYVDNTKLYRSSVWMRRTTSTYSGNLYHGLHTNGTGDVYNLANGASEGNPYWQYGGLLGINQNTWYLFVGHIYPWNYTGTTAHVDSGYYAAGSITNLGTYGGNITDCKFPSNATTMTQRVYHYYCGDNVTRLQFFQPRIDIVDGTQPTISELIDNAGTKLTDLGGSNRTAILTCGPNWNSNGYLSFDGINDYIEGPTEIKWTPDGSVGYSTLTIEMWFRTTDSGGLLYSKPWNGSGQYNIGIAADGISLRSSSGGTGVYTYPATILDGNWKHLVVSISPTQLTRYVNGSSVVTDNHNLTGGVGSLGDFNLPTAIMTLYPYGSTWGGITGHAIQGDLASVKVYNRVLTAAEVKQNFNALRGRFGI